ncbi:C4-dicarboxylate ABC transporter [Chromatiales bacterium (ex Bugula neritina AB1)]|nr:C4-dicarboxylate ABC transporter [Chromatiales bacterium (ex Bugula neritina AB1)]
MIEALPFLMLCSLVIVLFSGIPVAVVLFGLGVLFCGLGIALGEMPVAGLFNITPKLITSMSGSLFYPAVVMLLFMGVALEKAGIAKDMLTCLSLILKRAPGGLALSVLIIGVVLAPAAGIVGASVVTLSLIALPTLIQRGYTASAATGAVAAAGTVGIILPPAVMLFFLAGEFKVPLGSMFMATVVPGGLLICLYAVFFMWRGWQQQQSISHPSAESTPQSLLQWLLLLNRGLVLPVGLIALVLGTIIAGWATPSQSGAIGAAGGLLLVVINGRLTRELLAELFVTTARLSAMVFFIIMAAAVFAYPFRYFGGDTTIANGLNAINGGPWMMLLLIVGIIFVLGFFIDWIEITVITLPLMMPTLNALEFVDHIVVGKTTLLWIAAVVALVLQTSFITPPFGFALFFLKGSAPASVSLFEIYRGVWPILLIQLLVIALVLLFPELVLWLPEQIYGSIR